MFKTAIITRTKDRPLLLERTMQSVLAQSEQDWLHIIVNDAGSKEPVESLAQKYSSKYNNPQNNNRLKILHRETSTGMEAASNWGIKNSQSKYIVILDDDDSWEEEFLSKTTDYLADTPEIGGVITHSYYVTEKIQDKKIICLDKYPFNTDIKHLSLFEAIFKKVYPPPVSFVFQRACWEELGGFNEEMLKAGDIEFFIRFLARFEIDVITEVLSCYHTRPYNTNIYANSSLGNKNYKDNSYWENRLKNTLLRRDIEEKRFGAGFIYSLINSFKPLVDSAKVKNRLDTLKGRKVMLYGAGIRAKELLSANKNAFTEIRIQGILDQNLQKQGQELCGYKILPPESIKDFQPESILLTVANTGMVKGYLERLIKDFSLNCTIELL